MAQGLMAQGLMAQGLMAQGLVAQGLVAQGLVAQGLVAQGLVAQGLVAQGLVAQGLTARCLRAMCMEARDTKCASGHDQQEASAYTHQRIEHLHHYGKQVSRCPVLFLGNARGAQVVVEMLNRFLCLGPGDPENSGTVSRCPAPESFYDVCADGVG
jgi:hypothetical protein